MASRVVCPLHPEASPAALAALLATLTGDRWPTNVPDTRALLLSVGLFLGARVQGAPLPTGPIGGLPENYKATWTLTQGDIEIDMFPAETKPTDRDELRRQFEELSRSFDVYFTRIRIVEAGPFDAPAARWIRGECVIDLEARWSQPVIGVLQLHVARAAEAN